MTATTTTPRPASRRHQLGHLEGQLVLASGRRALARRTPDGGQNVCLRAVRLWRWDGDAAVSAATAGPPHGRLDHAWVSFKAADSGVEMGERIWIVGRVGWYTRRDGTIDLGLRPQLALGLEDALLEVFAAARGQSTAATAAALGGLLEAAELAQRRALLLCHASSGTETLALWRGVHRRLERSAAAEERARAGAARAQRGSRPTGLDLFPVPTTRRRRPAGIRPMGRAC